jgi:class 3 adenylate cyclase/tetratricopeptide (TPR) repeat protein
LEQAVAAEPLRERRWAQLMLALYRCGRQADALRAYQRLRGQLAEQLGIEPSLELKGLEEGILLQKPELDWQPPPTARPGPAGPEQPDRARRTLSPPALDPSDPTSPGRRGPTVPGQVVTFLFTDIEGSTRLWEQYPGRMASVLERHDRLVGDLVATEEGRVFKTVGDAVHAVFASPTAAVRAALAVQAGVTVADWGDIGRLMVRIGVYTGEAQQVEGEWRGRSVNRCARLLDAAAGGQILASHATIELVGDDLADQAVITNLGEHQLRGVPRAESVHQIEAAGIPEGAESASVASDAGKLAPLMPAPIARAARRLLIGRSAELDRLRHYLGRPQHTSGVVLITGEPGVGKTRLAAAAAYLAADDGTLVLYGRCDEGLGVPYQPFAEALGSYVNTAEPQKLAVQLRSSGHELGRVLPGLAERVAGLRPPTSTNPETQRWLLFQGAVHFLQALAAERPVLMVIDDLHWAEPATLLLLRHLARAEIDGLLMMATTRTVEPAALAEAVADLAREHHLYTVPLGGLNPQEVAALLANRLERAADPAFARATHHQTGGNPFFVHELVSHLNDLGILPARSSETTWPTAAEIEYAGAPEGMRQVLARRIGQLSPSARDALTMAAVAGEEFYAADVATACGQDFGEAITALEETTATGLTSEATERAGWYRFTHALVRHALYENMSALRRVQRHWQIAEAIRIAAAHPERRLNELAYHYRHGLDAADPTIAVHWLQAAGDHAVQQVAFEEARDHYRGALTALDRGPDDPDRRYDLLAGLALSASALSDYDASDSAWLAAAEIARGAGDAARFFRTVLGYGNIIRVGVEDQIIERLVADGLALAGPDDSAERAQFLAWHAATKWHGAIRRAEAGEQMIREALAMARRVNSDLAELEVLSCLGDALLGSGRVRELLDIMLQGQELVETMAAHEQKPWWLRNLSLVLLQQGERNQAEHFLRQAEVQARTLGIHLMIHNILMPRAAITIAEGRFAQAKSLVAEVRDIGGPHNRTIAAAYGGQVSAIRAEEGRADVVIDALRPLSQDPPRDLVAWRAMLAGLLADLDRLDEASEQFEALAPNRFSVVPRDPGFPLAIRYLAETCAQLGDTRRAAELLPEVEPYSGQMLIVSLGTSIEGAADRSLGQLYGLVGQIEDAERHFEMAWRLEDAMRFPALAARSRYWHGRLLAQSGNPDKREHGVALLQNTQEVSSQLGMAHLHQQTSNLVDRISKHHRVSRKAAPAAD